MVKIGKYTLFEKAPESRPFSSDFIKTKTMEAEKGKTATGYDYTARLPHPNNMDKYEEWSTDPEASEALNLLTKLITGIGFHTDPQNKPLDEYAERTNLDEQLEKATWQMLAKGFCPIEIIDDYRLKILPAETFYIYRSPKGAVLKYTQEYSLGNIQATWMPDELDKIMLLFNQETPSRPYSTSLLDSIGNLLDMRTQLNEDMKKGVHRWANPIPILETSKSKANSEALKTALETREPDEWMLIYDVLKDEVRWQPLTVEPSARFVPYVEMIYNQIAEGLHAPLLLYLKNATEASANVVMESVDRMVNGAQRHIKRRVEKHLFKPLVGDPVPRLVWGKPQSGLEKVTLTELAPLINGNGLATNQKLDLLKQYGIKLPDPDWKSGPPQPAFAPFGNKPETTPEKPKKEAEIEFLVEHLNNIDTSLGIITDNFHAGKLKLSESARMADDAITAHTKRMYPDGWEPERERMFLEYMKKLVAT